MIIRQARKTDDLETVLTLMQTAFQAHEDRINPPSSSHRLSLASLTSATLSGQLYLATVDPKIIGAVLLEQADTHLYLSKLVTHPQHLRKGVARALVAQAEALAKEWNLNALELQSRVELIENHLVFERFGFVEVRRTAHAGFSEPTSITFRKSL